MTSRKSTSNVKQKKPDYSSQVFDHCSIALLDTFNQATLAWRTLRPKGWSFLQRAFNVRNGECFTQHWHYSRLTGRNSRKSIPLFQDLLLLSENCLWFANSWCRSGLKNSRLLWLKTTCVLAFIFQLSFVFRPVNFSILKLYQLKTTTATPYITAIKDVVLRLYW